MRNVIRRDPWARASSIYSSFEARWRIDAARIGGKSAGWISTDTNESIYPSVDDSYLVEYLSSVRIRSVLNRSPTTETMPFLHDFRISSMEHNRPFVQTKFEPSIWNVIRDHPLKNDAPFFLNYRQQELYSTADESNLFETIQDACGSTRPNPIPRSRPRKPVESYKSQAQRFERIVSFLSVMRFLADGVTLSRVEDGSTKFNRTPSPRSFRFYIGRGKRGLVGCARCKSPVPLFSVYLSVLSAWFIGRPFHLVVGGIKRGRKRRGGGDWKKLKKKEKGKEETVKEQRAGRVFSLDVHRFRELLRTFFSRRVGRELDSRNFELN